MLLRRVAGKRGHLALDVAAFERHVGLVREAERVPRDLIAENGGAFERTDALGGDDLVVLVDVREARLQHGVRPPLLPQRDEELEDLLAMLGERSDVEVVHDETLGGDVELGCRFTDLAGERVRRKPLGQ